jgi:hypothetical protein
MSHPYLKNSVFRNIFSIIAVGAMVSYLTLPFFIQKYPETINSTMDTFRNILMLIVGFYFGSSDYERDIQPNGTTPGDKGGSSLQSNNTLPKTG